MIFEGFLDFYLQFLAEKKSVPAGFGRFSLPVFGFQSVPVGSQVGPPGPTPGTRCSPRIVPPGTSVVIPCLSPSAGNGWEEANSTSLPSQIKEFGASPKKFGEVLLCILQTFADILVSHQC